MTRLLGVVPTAVEDGLRRGFAWYLAQPLRPADYTFKDRVLQRA